MRVSFIATEADYMWATFHFSGFDGGKINSLQEEGRGEEAAAAEIEREQRRRQALEPPPYLG